MRQKKSDKKQTLTNKADLTDWLLAIDANCPVKTKLREGLYLKAGLIVY